jgi:hypothetical protein
MNNKVVHTKFWKGSLKEGNRLHDIDVDVTLISHWKLKKLWGNVSWVTDSEYGSMASSCEHGNEPSDSLKFWEFLQ